jgi:hypothetical protein
MKLLNWLKKWNLESLKINAHFLGLEFNLKDADKIASSEMYTELITRISTQFLRPEEGDEEAALKSLYSLFETTRQIIRKNGPGCIEFAKVAVVILNQVLRPFTAKWHKRFLLNKKLSVMERKQFRDELEQIQKNIRNYTGMLSDFAGVENLLELEYN